MGSPSNKEKNQPKRLNDSSKEPQEKYDKVHHLPKKWGWFWASCGGTYQKFGERLILLHKWGKIVIIE